MTKDERKYSRVYWSVNDDPKFDTIRSDSARFGSWVRLLMVADAMWPNSAHLPRWLKASHLDALVTAGIVDVLPDERFRIHGMDNERGPRSEAARAGGIASGRSRSVERPLNDRSNDRSTKYEKPANLDETRRDETRRADARDPWDDPERDAVSWLAKHGCALPPHSGYYRHLVTMTETHGVNAVVGMFDRLAEAGTRDGDVKGYVFGARDALDAKTRPSLADIGKADRAESADRAHRARLDRTQAQLRELRGESA